MTDWRDLLSEQVRQLEAKTGNPALTPKAFALLAVIRGIWLLSVRVLNFQGKERMWGELRTLETQQFPL